MKQVRILFAFTLLTVLISGQQVHAQDFFKTSAGMCKMLGDTTFATAAEVTFNPGQKTTLHTHSAQFIYALTDGTLTVHYADGKTMEFSLKQGDSMIAPAEGPHWTENLGKKPIKFILVEFDEHPYMMEKMMKTK